MERKQKHRPVKEDRENQYRAKEAGRFLSRRPCHEARRRHNEQIYTDVHEHELRDDLPRLKIERGIEPGDKYSRIRDPCTNPDADTDERRDTVEPMVFSLEPLKQCRTDKDKQSEHDERQQEWLERDKACDERDNNYQ